MIELRWQNREGWGWCCTCGDAGSGFDTTTRAIDDSLYHAEDCEEVFRSA